MRFIARDSRGSASIFVLVSCIVLLIVSDLVFNVALYAVKVSVRHSLNLALRTAVAQLDMDALADPDNPRLVIDPQAEEKFYQVLRDNLRLDTSNAPLPGSIADGPVAKIYLV